ncbi:MAG TPA: DUF1080 domain-containing protein [Gemmataceae bacterium]|jgi:hypothetical protein|nr:DUF1080 domain-containing protein [Gemmataceae bacterium]
MRTVLLFASLSGLLFISGGAPAADDAAGGWRALPLIKDGKVDPAWSHVGYGGWTVEDGAIRTDSDERGLGLLVYRPEKFGNCQIRVVFKAKDARSNSGVYIRIDDGILSKLTEKHAPARRTADGKLQPESLKTFEDASERDLGPWYAVHHGYEVQICDTGDPGHRTGSIYSLARTSGATAKAGEWRTMIITLTGNKVQVDLDGKRVTEFDADAKDLPARKQWHEPKREPKRPTAGYIGLQTHDPGDVVWFKEISVRPLSNAKPATGR